MASLSWQDGGAVRVVWLRAADAGDLAEQLVVAEVARVWGSPVDAVRLARLCPRCGSASHGRPVVLGARGERLPSVSLSRTDGVVVAAVSEAGPVGIDVERLDAARFAGFDDVALHPAEHAHTIEARARMWVRKESLLKATGDALHLDPGTIRVSDPDALPELLAWPEEPAPEVRMRDLPIEGYAACVSVLSSETPGITVRQEAPEALSR